MTNKKQMTMKQLDKCIEDLAKIIYGSLSSILEKSKKGFSDHKVPKLISLNAIVMALHLVSVDVLYYVTNEITDSKKFINRYINCLRKSLNEKLLN